MRVSSETADIGMMPASSNPEDDSFAVVIKDWLNDLFDQRRYGVGFPGRAYSDVWEMTAPGFRGIRQQDISWT